MIYRPNNPPALHLHALLARLPAEIEPVLALPQPPPAWLAGFRTEVQDTPDTEAGRLRWEQRWLPQLARETGARLLHTTSTGTPLFGKAISVISPSDFDEVLDWGERTGGYEQPGPPAQRPSFAARLRASLASGGLARARTVFWPSDIPRPDLPARIALLPPAVHPAFHVEQDTEFGGAAQASRPNGRDPRPEAWPFGERPNLDLPETYVLYNGPTGEHWLRLLLDGWSWAASPVGDYHPLLILGLDEAGRRTLAALRDEFNLGDTVQGLPAVPPGAVPGLYRGCSALFHPAPLSPWGEPIRHALACGKPVVAAESTLADAIAGPAAYLAPAEDARALGAGLITVIVEEEVAENLAQKGRLRAAAWQSATFGRALLSAYQDLLSGA